MDRVLDLYATGSESGYGEELVCDRFIEWIGCWTCMQLVHRVDMEENLCATGSESG